MSRNILIGLFCCVFFVQFVIFQFEADARKKTRSIQSKLDELDLKFSTYIRAHENDGAQDLLNRMGTQQQHLRDDFKKSSKSVIKIMELLIEKDEKFSKEIDEIKKEIEELKQ